MDPNVLTCQSTGCATMTNTPADAVSPMASWLPRGRMRRAMLWGIASTALSGMGLVGLALFEQYNGMLAELRSDLKHFNETQGEYVKKERMQKCWERLKDCSREMASGAVARERLEHELRASERAREDMAQQLQRLRERLAYVEGLKTANSTRLSGLAIEP